MEIDNSLLILPLIGAAIGWLTNYIAVKMLFHPRQPIGIGLFSIQGVFPRRQRAFAKKLGEIVSDELFSITEITDHLRNKVSSDKYLQHVMDRLESALTEKLPEVVPVLGMFIKQELIKTVVSGFIPELRTLISEIVEKLSAELQEEMNIQRTVEEKVAAFSTNKLEDIVFSIMRRELRFVELVGGVLGFIIGSIQVGLLIYLGK